eukprot:TRINITY_DN117315_c0_g1_i1.p2 TRINITY_DN117315_c0_g1~~TRINITY_DN117315_c0_g1_i1.p2  ORF type:complete len:214 (+),score=47.16 TRINITY_DN117315_c0_g1_i1:105-746(+)
MKASGSDDGALSDVSDYGDHLSINPKVRYGMRNAYKMKKAREDEEKRQKNLEVAKQREEDRKRKDAERQQRHAQGEFSSDESDSGFSDVDSDAGKDGGKNDSDGDLDSFGKDSDDDSDAEKISPHRSNGHQAGERNGDRKPTPSPIKASGLLRKPDPVLTGGSDGSTEADSPDNAPGCASPAGSGLCAVRRLKRRSETARVSFSLAPPEVINH